MLKRSRLRGVVRAFERRSLQLLGVIAVIAIAFGVNVGPTTAAGAVLVSVGTSLAASVIVAAFALEREAFAQLIMDLGVDALFRDRKREFDDDFWTRMVERARSHYRVLGTANHGYWHDEQAREDTKRTLRDAIVKRQVEVEFLFLRPDGDLCGRRGKEEQRDTRKDALASIEQFWLFRESLPEDARRRLLLKEYEVTPSCGITWADDTLLVTHYLAGRNNLGSPGILLRSGRPMLQGVLRPVSGSEPPAPLTDIYIRNYREIASPAKSTTISPERFAALQDQLRQLDDVPSVSEADLRGADDGEL
ncbi:MAG TPA: hypothetical protein VF533_11580 [Solirubrobacteraceae bacterium]|jgi:hypothetical protein